MGKKWHFSGLSGVGRMSEIVVFGERINKAMLRATEKFSLRMNNF
jgi:hypothetical protein